MDERLTNLLSTVFDMQIADINISLTKNDLYKWDSLLQMELVSSIEKEFNIQLRIEDIIAMDSVRNIITILSKYGVIANYHEH